MASQVPVCLWQTGAKHHFRYAKVHILASAGFSAEDSADQPPPYKGGSVIAASEPQSHSVK